MKNSIGILFAVLIVCLSACGEQSSNTTTTATPQPTSDVTLTISAAANVSGAFTEIGEAFTQTTGIKVEFNFAASGQLTQQILQGAPVDVFASADEAFVDELANNALIIAETRVIYAIGRLTLWTRADSPLVLESIEDINNSAITNIAIANPETAPYGIAAREALQSVGLWDTLQTKLVFGENIAQTLQYAESGNADVAFVALALAIPTDGKWIIIPDNLHNPIRQAMAVVNTTQHETEARQFVSFVNGEIGREILTRYGFATPNEE